MSTQLKYFWSIRFPQDFLSVGFSLEPSSSLVAGPGATVWLLETGKLAPRFITAYLLPT